MDHHNDHHEESKPSNKWVATPILLAFFTIAALVTFLSLATRTCCGGECKEKAKTEEHGGGHGEGHDDHNTQIENNEMLKDSTTATSDSTGKQEQGDSEQGESHGH
jgi:hypothetical protein